MSEAARRRTVSWAGSPDAPAHALLGLHSVPAEAGHARLAMPPGEYHYNPLGSVHGGVIASLAAAAMAAALPPDRHGTMLELKANYLRALTMAAGEAVGDAAVVHAGRRTAMTEARVTDAASRLYAAASATWLLADVPPPGRPPETGQWEAAWADPHATARAGMTMQGLDLLRDMAAGRLPAPPAILLLGISLDAVEPGQVTMTLPPGPHLLGADGAVHPGMIATLLDSVMGCAVHSTLPVGQGYTTLEIKVNFLHRVMTEAGALTGIGRVVHAGPQAATAEAQARDAAGRLCAIASTTCLVFSHPARA